MRTWIQTMAVLLMLTSAGDAIAQGPPKGGEERLKRTLEMLKTEVGMSADQYAKVEVIFKDFFAEQQRLRGSQPQQPPTPEMRAEMRKRMEERDAKVKEVLDAAQYAKYLEVMEKNRPKPPGRGKGGAW